MSLRSDTGCELDALQLPLPRRRSPTTAAWTALTLKAAAPVPLLLSPAAAEKLTCREGSSLLPDILVISPDCNAQKRQHSDTGDCALVSI